MNTGKSSRKLRCIGGFFRRKSAHYRDLRAGGKSKWGKLCGGAIRLSRIVVGDAEVGDIGIFISSFHIRSIGLGIRLDGEPLLSIESANKGCLSDHHHESCLTLALEPVCETSLIITIEHIPIVLRKFEIVGGIEEYHIVRAGRMLDEKVCKVEIGDDGMTHTLAERIGGEMFDFFIESSAAIVGLSTVGDIKITTAIVPKHTLEGIVADEEEYRGTEGTRGMIVVSPSHVVDIAYMHVESALEGGIYTAPDIFFRGGLMLFSVCSYLGSGWLHPREIARRITESESLPIMVSGPFRLVDETTDDLGDDVSRYEGVGGDELTDMGSECSIVPRLTYVSPIEGYIHCLVHLGDPLEESPYLLHLVEYPKKIITLLRREYLIEIREVGGLVIDIVSSRIDRAPHGTTSDEGLEKIFKSLGESGKYSLEFIGFSTRPLYDGGYWLE